MKKRLLNGDSFSWIAEKSVEIKRFDDFVRGYISRIKIQRVKEKVTVDGICFGDDGYTWYMFLPDGKNWCLTVQYDREDRVVEWYFDITLKNSVNQAGVPFHDDLYLDISVFPDASVILLDEDELEEAFKAGEFSREVYALAYAARQELLESPLVIPEFLSALSGRIRAAFDSERTMDR